MRLGGPIFEKTTNPHDWAAAVKRLGYSAAFCPLPRDAPEDLIRDYASAAKRADIVIAEVGAWSNPLSPNEEERTTALALCREALTLADRIGARCCVNIAGSRGPKWDGPAPADLTDQTFDLIAETVRSIIDAVRPTRTFYTLETMPWMYPDSTDSYFRLIAAIDRKAFAVHFDPVNLINSPRRSFSSGAVIREFVGRLGPHIRSCHAKDSRLGDRLTVHLEEVPPGQGTLDYRTYLRELGRLDPDMPLMMEHMRPEEYSAAAAYIRSLAADVGVAIH